MLFCLFLAFSFQIKAIFKLVEKEKIVTEGGGAVTTAAIMADKTPLENSKIVAIVSGGNIDMTLVKNIIDSNLIDNGYLVEVKVSLPNKPGHLKKLLKVIAATKANISTISQTNVKPHIVIGNVEVTMGLETRGKEHINEIYKLLEENGYEVIQ